MDKDSLIELRNKIIQFYQFISLIETKGIGLEEALEKMKTISKSMMDSIEGNIKVQTSPIDTAYDKLLKPIDLCPETLLKLEDYLKPYKIKEILEE